MWRDRGGTYLWVWFLLVLYCLLVFGVFGFCFFFLVIINRLFAFVYCVIGTPEIDWRRYRAYKHTSQERPSVFLPWCPRTERREISVWLDVHSNGLVNLREGIPCAGEWEYKFYCLEKPKSRTNFVDYYYQVWREPRRWRIYTITYLVWYISSNKSKVLNEPRGTWKGKPPFQLVSGHR